MTDSREDVLVPSRLFAPLAPQLGWAAADRPRRVAAAIAIPLTALMVMLAQVDRDWSIAVVLPLTILLAPACYYSLARVLRPDPRASEGVVLRHLMASAATAFWPLLALNLNRFTFMPATGMGYVFWLLVPALLLTAVSSVWGVIVLAQRTSHRLALHHR